MTSQKKNGQGMAAMLMGMLALLAALATLVLVPASVPVLVDMEDPTILVTLASPEKLQWVAENPDDYPYYYLAPMVTGYSVCMAVGAAAAMGLTAWLGSRRGLRAAAGLGLALAGGLGALVCSHGLYFVVRYSYIINDFADLGGSPWFILEFWKGGYTMYGAILGGLLGAAVFALASRRRAAEMLQVIVPGMLLMVAAGRFGEFFTGYCHGIANERATEALSFLPFAKLDFVGEPRVAVNAYEMLAALAALALCLAQTLRRAPVGRGAENGLVIVSAWQLMMESWRGDELIKFGFVCLNMLMAAAVLAFILVTRIVRCVRGKGWSAWQTLRIALFVIGAAVVICVEFALDGKIKLPGVNSTMIYGGMTVAVLGMMASVLFADGRDQEVR